MLNMRKKEMAHKKHLSRKQRHQEPKHDALLVRVGDYLVAAVTVQKTSDGQGKGTIPTFFLEHFFGLTDDAVVRATEASELTTCVERAPDSRYAEMVCSYQGHRLRIPVVLETSQSA